MICPVNIRFGEIFIPGELFLPHTSRGLVIFADTGASSRVSRSNQALAQRLYRKGYAVLACDLLLPDELRHTENRFDIGLLTKRLTRITMWARSQETLNELPAGYFASGTGAAAALSAAALLRFDISCVVARSGRPDLAGENLKLVGAHVLLVAGSLDTAGIEVQQKTMHSLQSDAELLILPGAGHLFEESGRTGRLFHAAIRWFDTYLTRKERYSVGGVHP